MPYKAQTDGQVAACARFAKGARVEGFGVRIGTAQYPDYAWPDFGGDYTGGRMMSIEEAEAYADQIKKAAAWSRAQNTLEATSPCPS